MGVDFIMLMRHISAIVFLIFSIISYILYRKTKAMDDYIAYMGFQIIFWVILTSTYRG